MKKTPFNTKNKWRLSAFLSTLAMVTCCSIAGIAQEMVLVSNATKLAEKEYRLTEAKANQMGAIWSPSYIDLKQDFTIKAELYFGTDDFGGADGIAFVLQPNCTGAGSPGGGLGYQGITPSLAIEFDTYQNAAENGDPQQDHISVMKNGVVDHNADYNKEKRKYISTSGQFENYEIGAYLNLTIGWTAITKKLILSFQRNDQVGLVNEIVINDEDIINTFFNGNNLVFWGFTASTGAAFNEQKVKITSASVHKINPFTVKSESGAGKKDGEIQMKMTGGNPPFSYSFSAGGFQSDPKKTGLSANTYKVIAKDSRGCESKFDIEVPQLQANCETSFFFSDAPKVGSNNKQATGIIKGINYTYTSDKVIQLADFSKPDNTIDPSLKGTKLSMQANYPKALNIQDGSAVFNADEITKLSTAVQIKNTEITKNTITFSSPVDNPVLYFSSIGSKGLKVPIRFSSPVKLLGSQGVVEISADGMTVTGEEGVAIVGITGKATSIVFEYTVPENACFFFFGASFTDCNPTCDNSHYIKDEVKYTKEIMKPATGDIRLKQGEKMISGNGEYHMRITSDERMVIEKILATTECGGKTVVTESREVWETPKGRDGNWESKTVFKFGYDGNICFLNLGKSQAWCLSFDVIGNPYTSCKKLVLTDDGRLVLVGQNDQEIWTSTPKPIVPDITDKSGNWAYGYGGPGDSFTKFEQEKKEDAITRNFKTGDGWWSIAQNTSITPITDVESITYPPKTDGAFIFHPGSESNQSTKARFTASTDGTYTFNTLWKLVDLQGTKVNVEIYTNAISTSKDQGKQYATVFKKVLSNTLLEKTIYNEFEVVLKTGEWVSIEVENGGDGHSNDSTLVEMSSVKSK